MELGALAGSVATRAVDDYYNARLADKQSEIDAVKAQADDASARGDNAEASRLYEQVDTMRAERDSGYGVTTAKTVAAAGISALTGNTGLESVVTYVGATGGIAYVDEMANKAMRGHDETSALKVTCTLSAQKCADLYRNMPAPDDGASMQDRLQYLSDNGMTIEFIGQIPADAKNIAVNGILNDEPRAGHVQVGHVSREDGEATDVSYYVQYNASKGGGRTCCSRRMTRSSRRSTVTIPKRLWRWLMP